jgi:hypothetical protein
VVNRVACASVARVAQARKAKGRVPEEDPPRMFDRRYLRAAVAEKYGWEPAEVERPSHPEKPPQTVTASPEPEHSQPAPARREW